MYTHTFFHSLSEEKFLLIKTRVNFYKGEVYNKLGWPYYVTNSYFINNYGKMKVKAVL